MRFNDGGTIFRIVSAAMAGILTERPWHNSTRTSPTFREGLAREEQTEKQFFSSNGYGCSQENYFQSRGLSTKYNTPKPGFWASELTATESKDGPFDYLAERPSGILVQNKYWYRPHTDGLEIIAMLTAA